MMRIISVMNMIFMYVRESKSENNPLHGEEMAEILTSVETKSSDSPISSTVKVRNDVVSEPTSQHSITEQPVQVHGKSF